MAGPEICSPSSHRDVKQEYVSAIYDRLKTVSAIYVRLIKASAIYDRSPSASPRSLALPFFFVFCRLSIGIYVVHYPEWHSGRPSFVVWQLNCRFIVHFVAFLRQLSWFLFQSANKFVHINIFAYLCSVIVKHRPIHDVKSDENVSAIYDRWKKKYRPSLTDPQAQDAKVLRFLFPLYSADYQSAYTSFIIRNVIPVVLCLLSGNWIAASSCTFVAFLRQLSLFLLYFTNLFAYLEKISYLCSGKGYYRPNLTD